MMLLQAVEGVAKEAGRIPWFDVGVIAITLKIFDSLGSLGLKAWRSRQEAKKASAQVAIEEAKAFGISLIKSRNSGPDKPALVAFCPAHIELIEKMARQEEQTKFVNEKLADIKDSVDAIRTAIGK